MRKPVQGFILVLAAMVLGLLSDWLIRPGDPAVAEEWDTLTTVALGFGLVFWLFGPNRGS